MWIVDLAADAALSANTRATPGVCSTVQSAPCAGQKACYLDLGNVRLGGEDMPDVVSRTTGLVSRMSEMGRPRPDTGLSGKDRFVADSGHPAAKACSSPLN